MKGRWDAGLPVVTVPQSGAPKAVTIVVPYYENPAFMRRQIEGWCQFPAHVSSHLSYIVVDDGSPKSPLEPLLHTTVLPANFRAFRVDVDVRWNWLAARNIGAHHAPYGWMVLTDMDHVITPETAEALVYGRHDPSVIYGFSRVEHTGETLAAHPNSWFLTRENFWKVGGYDETLSGHYGTDGDWRRRIAATVPLRILSDRLVRHEHVGDSSTSRYKRKQPQDAAVRLIVNARRPGWKPKTLSFPYHELSLQEATCLAP